MNDLFPDSLDPDHLGFDVVPLLYPTFFAIYPQVPDIPRLKVQQSALCRAAGRRVAARPGEILHVSLVGVSSLRRRTTSLERALQKAAVDFDFPRFEMHFDRLAAFGSDGRALVAVADDDAQHQVRLLNGILRRLLALAGMSSPSSVGVAHMTLGYGDMAGLELGPIEPFGFEVSGIDLISSLQGKTIHKHLAHWPCSVRMQA